MIKLTENQTIQLLVDYLSGKGWSIESVFKGNSSGSHLAASFEGTKMFVEVNGARPDREGAKQGTEVFNNYQIKENLGRALVNIFETMEQNGDENVVFAVAHPDDPQIHKTVDKMLPYLKKLGICHYWVSLHGIVLIE